MTANAATTPTTLPAAQAGRPIAWFDIPVHDLDRATRFYETVLDTTLQREQFGGLPIARFNREGTHTAGCLVQDPHGAKPSKAGTTVYLNAGASVAQALARATHAGGAVDGPVIELPRDIGYIVDTEGNRVGLHAHGR
ncbi:MAG: hypothetical protein GAK40_01257 [Burkholderia plantarii]|nr:MAG: hypothetical protein GAK40_01257 [Burkholderia plantarii]